MSERKSIVEVHPVVWPEEAIKTAAREHYPDLTSIQVQKWALFIAANGDVYAVNTEGVGPTDPLSEDNPLIVLVAVSLPTVHRGMKAFRIDHLEFEFVPQEDDLMDDKTVNLADWIRSFGERLEYNFNRWNNTLTPLVAVKEGGDE